MMQGIIMHFIVRNKMTDYFYPVGDGSGFGDGHGFGYGYGSGFGTITSRSRRT